MSKIQLFILIAVILLAGCTTTTSDNQITTNNTSSQQTPADFPLKGNISDLNESIRNDPNTIIVELKRNQFEPNRIDVSQGQDVLFFNRDPHSHAVRLAQRGGNIELTREVGSGEYITVNVVSSSGIYDIFDDNYTDMKGIIYIRSRST